MLHLQTFGFGGCSTMHKSWSEVWWRANFSAKKHFWPAHFSNACMPWVLTEVHIARFAVEQVSNNRVHFTMIASLAMKKQPTFNFRYLCGLNNICWTTPSKESDANLNSNYFMIFLMGELLWNSPRVETIFTQIETLAVLTMKSEATNWITQAAITYPVVRR